MKINNIVVFFVIVMGSLMAAAAGYLFSFFALFSLGFLVCCTLFSLGIYLILYAASILLEDLEEKEKKKGAEEQ